MAARMIAAAGTIRSPSCPHSATTVISRIPARNVRIPLQADSSQPPAPPSPRARIRSATPENPGVEGVGAEDPPGEEEDDRARDDQRGDDQRDPRGGARRAAARVLGGG